MPLKELKIFLVALCLLFSSLAEAREITLFDREGTAIAYIDTGEDMTIFLWNGSPVAYLEKSSIYGFNGKHLGWFKDGIVRDRQGNGVGFIEGAVNKLTKLEPLKSLQKLTPLRSLQDHEPLEPMFRDSWSRIPLDLFLLQGAK
ncbi:MAG: 4-fold beta flower protein [Burkholderiales bacterium]